MQEYEKQYIKEFTQILKRAEPKRVPGTAVSAETVSKLNSVNRSDVDQKVIKNNGKVGSNINISV